jgi:hypothetical protein
MGEHQLLCCQIYTTHSRKKRRTVAEALGNDTWISDFMHDLSAPLLVDYMLLWVLVDAAAFNSQDQAEDEIWWTRTTEGVYSAKSAYDMQFDGSLGSSFPARVWNVWVPSRCKVIIGLLLQNKIWTAD